MRYEDFRQLWVDALARSRLRTFGGLEESIALDGPDRRVRSYAEARDGDLASLHVSAALEWRWDAFHAARTATNEEDLLRELGLRDGTRTRRSQLRVHVTLRASALHLTDVPMPSAQAWRVFAREVADRLVLGPEEVVRETRGGLLEILAYVGQPEARVEVREDGRLRLLGVRVEAWEAVELPRVFDDPDRRPDPHPGAQLDAILARTAAALQVWVELTGRLR